ncbi:hypothetical protein AJ78_01249 [Emergomyces pasteurianus Ep9510]|uniref:Uncharacterized protein n=1 Tax=Emergomyces pasteurianus Ep9510 TaxID=1447872 RepID=A0A1J9PS89_9EURO|nr:hypothetical protein AJ78_01249 [Emergomyces pasteurianus Ep9510]
MKWCLRLAVVFSCLKLVILWFLVRHLHDRFNQDSAVTYIIDSVLAAVHPESIRGYLKELPNDVEVGDKIIVMARLEEENADWVQDELPDWQRAIYVVNPSQKTLSDRSVLTTPVNKGHESMAYLTYIIDNYHNLPRTIAFLHAHRSGYLRAWHVDAPLHDNAIALRLLQLDYVQLTGYVNLRCNWNPGCIKAHRINLHVTDKVWMEVFAGTGTAPWNQSSSSSTMVGGSPPDANDDNNRPLLQPMDKPKEVAAACCAQFAVSRDQVHKRSLNDYVQFRNWVLTTKLSDASSGRVMEYLWHIIFGMDAVFCPEENECYCAVFGQCR